MLHTLGQRLVDTEDEFKIATQSHAANMDEIVALHARRRDLLEKVRVFLSCLYRLLSNTTHGSKLYTFSHSATKPTGSPLNSKKKGKTLRSGTSRQLKTSKILTKYEEAQARAMKPDASKTMNREEK
jgi:hypothetical protein